MRFGLVHRILIDLLALLGLLSLITSGELNPWITGGISLFLAIAFLIPERYQDHKWLQQFGVVASMLLLTTQVTRLVLGGEALKLAVEFAAALQVVRLLTRRGAVYDQQIILLALLHLVAGTVLGGGLAYGLCFLGFLVVAPGALVLSHLRREVEGNYRQGARDRTGSPVDVPRILRSRRVISKKFLFATCSLSIPVFIFTAFLFVLFPRVGLSLLLLDQTHTQRMVGFSDHVDLGGVGKLRANSTIALRVYPEKIPDSPPQRLALYLRGTAFDTYDGRSWARTNEGRVPAQQTGNYVLLGKRGLGALGDATMTIDLEPITPPIIFIPQHTRAIQVLSRGEPLLGFDPTVLTGPEGQVEYNNVDDRGIRYRVFESAEGNIVNRRLPHWQQSRYLTLPANLPARIGELAHQWVGSTSDPSQMAQIIQRHLQTEYRYDLDSPSGSASNPLDDFLFESKSGHCEFYSTALAILLRTLGVPTRNVTGFIGGSYNRFGDFYAVRQGDAHSWVEVYIDSQGWVSFDPTPPASMTPRTEVTGLLATLSDLIEAASQRWSRHVVGYDLHQQVNLLRVVGRRYAPFAIGDHRLTPAHKRRLYSAALGIGLAISLLWLWRRGGKPSPSKLRPSREERAAVEVVALYKSLETAMSTHGVPRPPGLPPLTHAQALAKLCHPIGEEALALTRLYVEARFGDRSLSDEARRDFRARVRALQAQKRTSEAKRHAA